MPVAPHLAGAVAALAQPHSEPFAPLDAARPLEVSVRRRLDEMVGHLDGLVSTHVVRPDNAASMSLRQQKQ